jgi:hypothetical protein
MQNAVLPATVLRALLILDHHKVAVSWVGNRVEFRSAATPSERIVALLDSLEPAIVAALRPNGDGRSLLDLARERHRPLLEAVEKQRPPDVDDDHWQEATNGLWVFLASGRADEALSLGWPRDELFAVPPVWANVALCGAGLLIRDREVIEVTANGIQIKTDSGSILSFYRKPKVDYRLVYETRRKSLVPNLGHDEAHFRALDFAINFCRQHAGVSLEEAKALVRAAIAAALDGAQK